MKKQRQKNKIIFVEGIDFEIPKQSKVRGLIIEDKLNYTMVVKI